MTDSYEKEINNLKENLDKAKSLKIRAEARLEQLNKQRQEILKELDQMGVKPDQLEQEIKRLKEEIESLIQEANGMLPMDLIKNC